MTLTVPVIAAAAAAAQGSYYRNSIRWSWLNVSVENTVTKLVMRGYNASQIVLREAAIFQDTIFLRANATLRKYEGAILGTLLWYECATVAWPSARHIGKAEDDLWLHLPDVFGSLHDAARQLAQAKATQNHSLYWGLQETYHLEMKTQIPLGFNHEWSLRRPCRQPEDNQSFMGGGFAGPFPFMKGPIYFVSASLAKCIVSNVSWEPRVRALEAAKANRKVYEDVWTGYALSQLDPPPKLALVKLGGGSFDEIPGFAATNGSCERPLESNAGRSRPMRSCVHRLTTSARVTRSHLAQQGAVGQPIANHSEMETAEPLQSRTTRSDHLQQAWCQLHGWNMDFLCRAISVERLPVRCGQPGLLGTVRHRPQGCSKQLQRLVGCHANRQLHETNIAGYSCITGCGADWRCRLVMRLYITSLCTDSRGVYLPITERLQ